MREISGKDLSQYTTDSVSTARAIRGEVVSQNNTMFSESEGPLTINIDITVILRVLIIIYLILFDVHFKIIYYFV